MSSKHTPGPWRTETHIDIVKNRPLDIYASYGTVARVQQIVDDRMNGSAEANACLIAAAPELLEACKEAHAELEAEYGICTDCNLCRAIAKAEGK